MCAQTLAQNKHVMKSICRMINSQAHSFCTAPIMRYTLVRNDAFASHKSIHADRITHSMYMRLSRKHILSQQLHMCRLHGSAHTARLSAHAHLQLAVEALGLDAGAVNTTREDGGCRDR